MSRTIAAMYDTRAEAEFARVRLVSRVKATSPRIIGKDTVAALDTADIDSADKDSYREQLRDGGHLLIAQAPSGVDAERIIELLEEAVGHEDRRADQHGGDSVPTFGFEPSSSDSFIKESDAVAVEERLQPPAEGSLHDGLPHENLPALTEQKLPSGKPDAPAAGARVRSFTHDAPVERQVTMLDETITVENRPSQRRLTDSELEAGGLFEERVIEIAQMREEPVVTKFAVVREEVVVRKTVKERIETIRDTVRQTQVQVEDLESSPDSGPAFFGAETDHPPRRG